MRDFWIFGYGSLMWNPGFPYDNKITARLDGYHRALCIYSSHYRGTPEKPGLVLGLSHGGHCIGQAFHVSAKDAKSAYDYVVAREQINNVYKETYVPVVDIKGSQGQVCALTFVADENHEQYGGALSLEEKYEIVAQSEGAAGKNMDYIANTVFLLREHGIVDEELEHMLARASLNSAAL